jgi:hypothetical protein
MEPLNFHRVVHRNQVSYKKFQVRVNISSIRDLDASIPVVISSDIKSKLVQHCDNSGLAQSQYGLIRYGMGTLIGASGSKPTGDRNKIKNGRQAMESLQVMRV